MAAVEIAAAAAAASSSSSIVSSTCKRHDVFLSFTGGDVRNTFLSHLFTALRQKNIETFKDDVILQIGDYIPDSLIKGIEESRISIVVFSKNYAFSSWCLRELRHIVRCKRDVECILPVFYNVDPSDVRNQKGSYAAAFVKHERRRKFPRAEITEWKHALSFAADISGCHISQSSRSESDLVAEIVKAVLRKLNRISPINDDNLKNLVGMHNRIREFRPLLCDGSPGERIIGIWGDVGVGKTTLASVVFNRFSSQFESSYFLADVDDKWKNHGSRTTLREKLFEGLLGKDSIMDGTPDLLSRSAKERLSKTKVLVVLDDVSSLDQFKAILLRGPISFGNESRIIVTSKDKQVLRSIKASKKYQVKGLNHQQALKLFCLHAFESSTAPTDEYEDFSKTVVRKFASGNPSDLEFFAVCLRSKNETEWKSTLRKLEEIPNPRIQCKLISGFDALDRESKKIFLDIAAFFKGEDIDFVETLLGGCYVAAGIGIKELIHKSLITVDRHNKLWMRALVQQMGHEIVYKESGGVIRNRCRLWKAEDICEVLSTDTGTEAVEGIFLDMSLIENPLHLSSAVFSRMSNLRFLKIYESYSVQESKVRLSQGLNSLPKFLVYFHWHKYPSKIFSLNFTPEKLVELSMPHSKVEKLIWNGNQNLVNLKRINLSYSDQLTDVPNLSKALNLESINLECCTSLREVPLDQNLDKLTFLNLKGCTRLQNLSVLPRNIACLDIRNCSTLVSIPTDIWELKSFSSLNLSGCSNFNSLPKISRPMECLIDLILDRTAIKYLPRSIFKLSALKTLSMNMCESLQFLPRNISRLYSLQCLSLRCCPKLKRLPALPPSLASVDARNCSSLERVFPSKAVIEGWNCNQHNGGAFIFYNCLNLKRDVQNDLMADARLRIMHIASVTSKYGGDHTTEICWPGNEIPKWFKYHSADQESSINVTLPSSQLDDTFLGFVFCVVVDFKDCNLDGDFEMYGESHCAFADGFVSTSRRTWNWHWNIHDSDNNGDKPTDKSSRAVSSAHVFIFYEKGQQILSNLRAGNYMSSSSSSSALANDNNVSITFKFQPRDPNGRANPVNFPVKSCGVQLLYLRDIKKLAFHSHDDREPIPEEGEITVVEEAVEPIVEDDEDENEPHLQENGTHSQEISDERKSFSCCLQLRTQILDCEPCFGKKNAHPTREMYSVTVTSSQTIQVTKAQWEKIQRRLDRLNDQNPRVYDALQRVEISRTSQTTEY